MFLTSLEVATPLLSVVAVEVGTFLKALLGGFLAGATQFPGESCLVVCTCIQCGSLHG